MNYPILRCETCSSLFSPNAYEPNLPCPVCELAKTMGLKYDDVRRDWFEPTKEGESDGA